VSWSYPAKNAAAAPPNSNTSTTGAAEAPPPYTGTFTAPFTCVFGLDSPFIAYRIAEVST